VNRLAVPVTEAAELIGVSESLMWKLIAEGSVPRTKIGRRTVIRITDLERFLSVRVVS